MISKLESEIQSDLSLEEQVPGKSDVLRPEAEFTSHCSPVEMLFPSLFVRDLENGKVGFGFYCIGTDFVL